MGSDRRTDEVSRADEKVLEEKIKHITDEELFSSLNLDRPGSESVRDTAGKGAFEAAYEAWATYWRARPQPIYIHYRGFLRSPDEVREVLAGHTEEREHIVDRADRVLRHEIHGWGDRVAQFGPVVDFNYDFGRSGKYGFHYWGWAQPLNIAYVATGDVRYLDAFDELFHQWYEQRDRVKGAIPSLDVIYYELGLGSNRNRTFLDYYRLNRDRCSLRTHERILKTVLGAARWLYELEKSEGSAGQLAGVWELRIGGDRGDRARVQRGSRLDRDGRGPDQGASPAGFLRGWVSFGAMSQQLYGVLLSRSVEFGLSVGAEPGISPFG